MSAAEPSIESSGAVLATLAYLAAGTTRAAYSVYPPASGRKSGSPPREYHRMHIADCRAAPERPSVEVMGFELLEQAAAPIDWFDPQAVRARYFPEVEALMQERLGALQVLAFDHNLRSVERAARGEAGVRPPVDGAHGDYTAASGPKRIGEILAERGLAHLGGHRAALINLWRPLRGPVQDVPLALCDARSVALTDLVDTAIDHYGENQLVEPRHSGHIYSVLHNPAHRWYYASDMQPQEALLLKSYDTRTHGVSRYTPHTGFANPACPPQFLPRESIEVRTVVVYPELRAPGDAR